MNKNKYLDPYGINAQSTLMTWPCKLLKSLKKTLWLSVIIYKRISARNLSARPYSYNILTAEGGEYEGDNNN